MRPACLPIYSWVTPKIGKAFVEPGAAEAHALCRISNEGAAALGPGPKLTVQAHAHVGVEASVPDWAHFAQDRECFVVANPPGGPRSAASLCPAARSDIALCGSSCHGRVVVYVRQLTRLTSRATVLDIGPMIS